MAVVGFSGLSLLLAFFIAIDTSEVYPPEVAQTFVENSLAGQTFTQQVPADTAVVFMTGNLGVCKSKKGIVIPLSELVAFAKEVLSGRGLQRNRSEDLAMLDGMHDVARSFLRMFHGEVGVALLNFPIGRRPPDFIVRADIDQSEMSFPDLAKKVGGIFGRAPASFVSEEDGYLIIAKKLYARIEGKKLYVSNSRLTTEQFLSGVWKEKGLSESPLYREAGKRVQFDQEQFLFVNVERIWGEFLAAHDPMPGEMNTIASSLFGNMRAIASSTRLSDGSLDVRSAVLFKDLTKGIPRILARPNARSQAATFVPEDYSLLVRGHTGPPVGFLGDIMGLNANAARRTRSVLDRFGKKLGLNVEEDLLPALSGDFAVAAKVPPMVGLPESLAIVRISDHDKAASVIKSLLIPEGLQPTATEPITRGFSEEYRGAELRIVPLPLVSLTYVFVEGHLLVGSSPGVVKAAIDAHLSGKSLAESDGYKAAFKGHPSETFGTIYADSQAMFDGLLNIGGGLAMWKGPGAMKEVTAPLIALLRRNVKDLSPVSWTICRDGDAIVVRANSRLFGTGPIHILLPAFFHVRVVQARQRVMMLREDAIPREQELLLKADEERRHADEMRLRDEMLNRAERQRKEQAIRQQRIEGIPLP
jgi:hypothetical protein